MFTDVQLDKVIVIIPGSLHYAYIAIAYVVGHEKEMHP